MALLADGMLINKSEQFFFLITINLIAFIMTSARGDDILSTKIPELDLIVFDLDYTLWPFWVDTHVTPPFRKESDGTIRDSSGQKVKPYPEVPQVLETLNALGYSIAIASRTSAVNEANKLIQLLDWDKYLIQKEIYPGAKTNHFAQFKKKLGINYSNMIFFDDEHRNIRDLNGVGVCSVLVGHGVDMKVVRDGFLAFLRENINKWMIY